LNVDADVEGTTSYGFAVEGKIVPPKLDDVGFYAYASFAFITEPYIDWFLSAQCVYRKCIRAVAHYGNGRG